VALAVFGLFALGCGWSVWITTALAQRRAGPAQEHRSGAAGCHGVAGVVAFDQPTPPTLASYSRMTRIGAKFGHVSVCRLFAVMIAGYLISTADGVGIPVFGLFEVPALVSGLPDQADTAGVIHLYLAWALVIFAGLHALAALKHHFIDRDATLRMLGRKA
jgi:cytochrome b561